MTDFEAHWIAIQSHPIVLEKNPPDVRIPQFRDQRVPALPKWLRRLLHPQWIVNDIGEFGVRFFGMNFYYYKYDDPTEDGTLEDCEPSRWRPVAHREFGETILSNWVNRQPGEPVRRN